MRIRDRIIEFKRVSAKDIRVNKRNYKSHTQPQREALRGILKEIGVAGALLAYYSERNGGKLTLIDGELRKTDNPKLKWPTLITDLNDEEADCLLTVYDPLTALADNDGQKLKALLSDVKPSNDAVKAMLARLSKANAASLRTLAGEGGNSGVGESNYREQYGVIVICAGEAEQKKVFNRLKGLGYNCRVVVT
jgi:hypothetical protein